MPTRPAPPPAPEDAPAAPTWVGDGSVELSQRARFNMLFNNPAVRSYLITAVAALAMIFLVMFQQGSDLGGVLIFAVGAAGVVLAWPAAPAFVLFFLAYFMVFPFGAPIDAYYYPREIEEGRFRINDLVLAMAVLVYVAAHFRVLGFTHQAIAPEGAVRRPDEPPTRRPPAAVDPSEVGTLLLVACVAVLLGQIVWWVVNAVEATPAEAFPFRWAPARTSYRRALEAGGLTPGLTRFVAMVGLLSVAVLLGRLVFGYWRLRAMRADEAAMTLLDDGWNETRRERSRQEKWRAWGRARENPKHETRSTKDDQ
ncbi:hypothetical protein [Gemmata sp.]|uniref:hypothetical protein n=1 Tax=Gemmata sp. TaxID=1914242 RepID=UPI003F70CF18